MDRHKRITRKELNLGIAELIAKRSTCGRLAVGCVITRNGRIISTGYNGPREGEPHCNETHCDLSKKCTRSTHAEINAIIFAAKHGINIGNATIYCTHSPCYNCTRQLAKANIGRIIYKEAYGDITHLRNINGIRVEGEFI